MVFLLYLVADGGGGVAPAHAGRAADGQFGPLHLFRVECVRVVVVDVRLGRVNLLRARKQHQILQEEERKKERKKKKKKRTDDDGDDKRVTKRKKKRKKKTTV